MLTNADIEYPLFGTRPVFQIIYGESTDGRLCEALLPEHLYPTLNDDDLHQGHINPSGFHPILAMGHVPIFETDMDSEELQDALDVDRLHTAKQRIVLVQGQVIPHLLVTCIEFFMGRTYTFRREENGNASIISSIRAGERLVIVTLAIMPIPGTPCVLA